MTATPRVEAPVTPKAYLTCVFAALGGILYGYDSGYIGGVQAMTPFIDKFGTTDSSGAHVLPSSRASLIVSILSAGTFFGAVSSGFWADYIGRRFSIIMACGIFCIGVILQVVANNIVALVFGRLIAGFGVGIVSAVVILYMSEVSPKRIRGAVVSGYQFAITVGLLLAAVVTNSTSGRAGANSYRIPIAIQFIYAAILAGGLALLPDSPRYYVKKGKIDAATNALARVRGQPAESEFIQAELAEIRANLEYELSLGTSSWKDCFTGGMAPAGNFRRVMTGVLLQMFQQATGINFIFYYGPSFFKSSGIQDSFVVGMITTAVNVGSTPLSWWAVEHYGRRKLLIWGAALMLVCEFIVAGVGTALPGSHTAQIVLIVFVCVYIFGFATTWGPAAWVVVGEIFPLPIRAKGVALSTASNWFWNCIFAVITPFMVDNGPQDADLKARVFFIWGSLCTGCLLFAYFFVPETKGLSLEQVDRLLEETTPRTSAKWVPTETFAHDIVGHVGTPTAEKEKVSTGEAV